MISNRSVNIIPMWGHHGRDHMVVEFTTTCAISAYPQRKPPTCHKSLTTLSHNVVLSTPRLSGIQTQNVCGDKH
jgi:hypothetical protein